jgi:hypothetical protein
LAAESASSSGLKEGFVKESVLTESSPFALRESDEELHATEHTTSPVNIIAFTINYNAVVYKSGLCNDLLIGCS